MRDLLEMLNKLYRSSEPSSSSDAVFDRTEDSDDMEVTSIMNSSNYFMNELLQVLPENYTEMNIHDFTQRNMTFESLDHVKSVQELELYKTEVKKTIDNLESLTWDDTVNNFVFGESIRIVHKSFEQKPPHEKKEKISKFINERLEHFKAELENAKLYVPNVRSKSTSPSFSFHNRPKSSIEKIRRPKSSLGQSSSVSRH